MIKFVKRDKNDIFVILLLNIIFKNRVFQKIVQILVLGLFIYAIYFGIINPTKEENLFTTGLFWGLFWPFFMVTTRSKRSLLHFANLGGAVYVC